MLVIDQYQILGIVSGPQKMTSPGRFNRQRSSISISQSMGGLVKIQIIGTRIRTLEITTFLPLKLFIHFLYY